MPHFHFNINGDVDSDGCDLSDVRVAQCEALAMAGRIICDEDADAFWRDGAWTMEVTTTCGMSLFQLVILGTEAPAIRQPAAPLPA